MISVGFMSVRHLLLNGLDAVPSTFKALLPQADSVVTTADSQDVTAQAPADTPDDSLEFEFCALPARRARRIGVCLTRPDAHSPVLRGRGNVRLGEGSGRPCDVAYPVRVSGEGADVVVGLGLRIEVPELDQVIAAASDEAT
jgi:hypothetical protein